MEHVISLCRHNWIIIHQLTKCFSDWKGRLTAKGETWIKIKVRTDPRKEGWSFFLIYGFYCTVKREKSLLISHLSMLKDCCFDDNLPELFIRGLRGLCFSPRLKQKLLIFLNLIALDLTVTFSDEQRQQMNMRSTRFFFF